VGKSFRNIRAEVGIRKTVRSTNKTGRKEEYKLLVWKR